MRWVITFLHDDASYEDVTVDEGSLVAAFETAMKRECPCHVIAVEQVENDTDGDGADEGEAR